MGLPQQGSPTPVTGPFERVTEERLAVLDLNKLVTQLTGERDRERDGARERTTV